MTTPHDDPLAELDAEVRRLDHEQRAAEAVGDARARLVQGRGMEKGVSTFFATLALRLEVKPDWKIETCETDGKRLVYNPEFILSLSPDARLTVTAHEVMHNALGHQARRGARDPRKWNEACDLAINPHLAASGFLMPPGALLPGRGPHAHLPVALSAEEYYALLKQDEQGDQPGDEPGGGEGEGDGDGQGGGAPDPGGMGATQDAGDGSPADAKQSQAEWEVAVAQAAQAAARRGTLPAGLARFVHELLNPKPDVAEVLRQFVSQACPADYSWAKPNRRMLAQRQYRPGLDGEDLGTVVMAVDTSGSIDGATLKRMGDAMQGVLEAYGNCKLVIVYHDAAVCGVQEWTPELGPLRMEPKGGGGTDHRPVFAWLEEHPECEAACLVCLTDAYSVFPDKPPTIPVLWAIVNNPKPQLPWGQVVEVH